MKSFVDVVKEYSAWKLQEKGSGKLTRKELVNLREKYNGTKPSRKITESKNKNSWEIYLKNYKQFKETKEHNSKISYKELKMLKESFLEASKRGLRLREADAGFNPAGAPPAGPVPGDPNAMPADPNGAMPGAPAAAVDPTIAAQIQDLVQSAEALAQAAGVGNASLGADPNAGIPAVDGQMDPNAPPADPNQQMMETVKAYKAWKLKNKGTAKLTENEIALIKKDFGIKPKSRYDQIKERIAARQATINGLQENSAQDYAKTQLNAMGVGQIVSNSHGGDHSTSEEQVKIPTAGQLANGYTSGKAAGETKPGKTWPTKAVGKEAGGALQGSGATQTKVKETEECDEEKKEENKLDEGVKNVTDIYLEKFYESKLSFDDIKSKMASGLLG